MHRGLPSRLLLSLFLSLAWIPCAAAALPRPLLGLWVDSFGPGLDSPAQIRALVTSAHRLGINTLFAEVVRRGDCFCNLASVPRSSDPYLAPGFDPLATLIADAKPLHLKVVAWINLTPVANVHLRAPQGASQAFNAHGLAHLGAGNWLSYRADGVALSGGNYNLDPGNPSAERYMVQLVRSIAAHYQVAGVMLDHVRYPSATRGRYNDWGYNAVALARFQREAGFPGVPSPSNPSWLRWRQSQVTELLRSAALAVKEVRPSAWVSTATLAAGRAPADLAAFQNSPVLLGDLQDWPRWSALGLSDFNVLMDYKRAHTGYRSWISFLRSSGLLAKTLIGSALYLNAPSANRSQIQQALASGALGWVGYSYRSPGGAGSTLASDLSGLPASVLADPAPLRILAGQVTRGGRPAGYLPVSLWQHGHRIALIHSDGNGSYAFFQVPRGPLQVVVGTVTLSASAQSGRVTQLPSVQLSGN